MDDAAGGAATGWDPAAGRLLVSSPMLGDPNFARSLVLLLNVDEDGALGVILNRPSEVPVAQVLASWASATGSDAVVFSGGPVEPEGALGVATLPADLDGSDDSDDSDDFDGSAGSTEPVGWRRLFGRTGLVDLDGPPADYEVVRIYAGYAGWSADQLEAEIAEGAWYVVPAEPGDLAATDPDLLWRRVLGRQPPPLNLLLTMPADPARN